MVNFKEKHFKVDKITRDLKKVKNLLENWDSFQQLSGIILQIDKSLENVLLNSHKSDAKLHFDVTAIYLFAEKRFTKVDDLQLSWEIISALDSIQERALRLILWYMDCTFREELHNFVDTPNYKYPDYIGLDEETSWRNLAVRKVILEVLEKN